MLDFKTSCLIIRGSAMDAMYVVNEFDVTLWDLDNHIQNFLDSLTNEEIVEWANDIAFNGCFLSYDYERSTKKQASFSLAS